MLTEGAVACINLFLVLRYVVTAVVCMCLMCEVSVCLNVCGLFVVVVSLVWALYFS